MLFMNYYDIDQAIRQFHGDPVLEPATRTLQALAITADAHSDGWAYWPKPCRAAKQLQALIQLAQTEIRRTGEHRVTAAEVRKAYTPIRSFYTRHRGLFLAGDIYEPAS